MREITHTLQNHKDFFFAPPPYTHDIPPPGPEELDLSRGFLARGEEGVGWDGNN